ncbi:MAG TPA: imidazolonepropionase [Gemmatimonadales bacterium]|nr:imidazolonepropionase [Gemmatimonadales bacterium]
MADPGRRLALVNVGAVATGPVAAGPVRHPSWYDVGVLRGVGVGIEDDRVALIAPDDEVGEWYHDAALPDTVVDCGGRLVTAGLVDAHTHAVFGRPRLGDHARRARGEDYKSIAAAGGGILSSVTDFRSRSEDELVALALPRLALMASLGTTVVEIKSGYGLALEPELKALRVVARLRELVPQRLVATFLGAHEVPPEFRSRRDAYIRLVVEEMLPAVARAGLASFCDVFCEPGVFSVEESAAILGVAAAHGLGLKVHADELDPSGGAELAARLGATSADHLGAVSAAGIEALAASDTVAVLLPGTLMFLGKGRQAPARDLVDAGAVVALATDFNPGSSPGANLPLMMTLAVSQARLQPEEAFIAATANAAHALGLAAEKGRVAVGLPADLVVWNCRDVRELAYWYGMPLAWRVYASGRPCHAPAPGISSAGSPGGPLSPPLS